MLPERPEQRERPARLVRRAHRVCQALPVKLVQPVRLVLRVCRAYRVRLEQPEPPVLPGQKARRE